MRETPWYREHPVDALEREAKREEQTARWAPPLDASREEWGVRVHPTMADALQPFLAPPCPRPPDTFGEAMDAVAAADERECDPRRRTD